MDKYKDYRRVVNEKMAEPVSGNRFFEIWTKTPVNSSPPLLFKV